ncbi:MAG: undecaprenyl/decaprenyl-phosphate alpha-N-acetylglucosaminyl 1-phosphate transferase [Elusimicrobia bacterium]|nr:undecaprenyl/decaprenyl-phosphate alpha-N-acetylglucosaminyl 1-phosphate transferase [Candidatus Liberimonas magnetica]
MITTIKDNHVLYLITFSIAFLISIVLTPLFRMIAARFNIMDHPFTEIKTHKLPTPYLGGLPIWIGWIISLFLIRLFTHFQTGTLRSLRGIIIGSIIIIILGLIDDILPKGLGFKKKFLFQILAALTIVLYDIRIHFISPYLIAFLLSMVWIVGITNAFNIVDIMDGLSSGLAFISCAAFLFIALPTEHIYVNFCAAGLAGGCLGFIPYNLSEKRKIFMGDTGSLAIGFILAATSLGTSYSTKNQIGFLAPLLMLAIPIYDTLLVSYFRIKKGKSPFLGSKDHFALRLELSGFSRKHILSITYFVSAFLSFAAYMITRMDVEGALILFVIVFAMAIFISYRLGKISVD